MSYRTSCACVLAGALLGVSFWTFGPKPRVFGRAQSAREGASAIEQGWAFRGTASCASSACHGRTGPQEDNRSSYTNWMARDRHAQAYQVLLSDRSRRMVMTYRHLTDLSNAHAETDLACLKCHSMAADQAQAGLCIGVQDGVGCERCHGPAQAWLGEHYTLAWQRSSAQEKAALGFRNTKDLVVRAKLCAECHVGAAGQDVDHDLIAAGHPRLNFEVAAYLATMPPHWSSRNERIRYPDLEARVWLIGQAVSAQQALELLAARAAAGAEQREKSWPEFAEYDCSACHHNLRGKSWRQEQVGKKAPGLLPWSDWYYALPRLLAGGDAPLALPDLKDQLTKLGGEMSKPLPDRNTVQAEARKTAQFLEQHLKALAGARPGSVAALRRTFDRIAAARQADLDETWDGATQRYLALAALYQALGDIDPGQQNPAERDALRALAKALRYPPGYDSPSNFDPASIQQRLTVIRQLRK